MTMKNDVNRKPFDDVVIAFEQSWEDAARAYDDGRISSERCLQSFLYHALVSRLDRNYKIFIESRIRFPNESTRKKRRYIDTIIAYQGQVALAIEIKFTSRGSPRIKSIRKDLASLSHMLDKSTIVDIVRIFGERISVSVSKNTRIAFGVFFAAGKGVVVDNRFFDRYRPEIGDEPSKKWEKLVQTNSRTRTLPRNLYILGAATFDKSKNNSDNNKTVVFGICNKLTDPDFPRFISV